MIDTTNKYKAKINNMFFKGDAVFGITYTDGKYGMEIDLEGAEFDMPVEIIEAQLEYSEENTFIAKATTELLPEKIIDITLTFEDDKCNGFLKIPFIGKVKIKDAVKV
ncbi:MAG: hypothetical protein IJ025_06945 [Clostridia bacterium]|nr:hypothetical protein [Clostridia bacterium]